MDLAVPVADETLKKVAELSGVYATLQEQFGYEIVRGDASTSWFRLAAVVLVASALAALLINRRLPT